MARSWSALVTYAIAAVALATGLAVAVAQVPPDNLLDLDAYLRVSKSHAAFGLALLPLLLVPMARSEWLTAPRLRGTALGLVLGGTILMEVSDSLGGFGYRVPPLVAPMGGFVLCIGALVFAWAIMRAGTERMGARICRVTALVWFAAWLGLRGALPALEIELSMPTSMHVFDPPQVLALLGRVGSTLGLCVALGATAASALQNAPVAVGPAVSAALCAVGVTTGALVDSLAFLLALGAGTALGVLAFRNARHAPNRWRRWVGRAQAVVFVEVLVPHAMLAAMDSGVHLHDTLFVVGASHLAFFAAALGWLHASDPTEERSAAVGLGAILAGGHGVVLAHLLLGSQGNPRRFAAYLDDQEGWFLLHGLAALAGAVLLVGCAAVALSMRKRERPGEF